MQPAKKLAFGKPENGWIVVRLGERVIHASDVPCDSIGNLASKLVSFLSGSKMEKVEWSLEPEYETWIFQEQDALASWSVENNQGELIQAIQSSKTEIVQMVAKALRDLYSSHIGKSDFSDQDWSWSFPIKELKILELKN
ncbi:hypothetical protein [Pelagicoccus sp. SDUM812003]|uniref:hypothetical protein n=1 Tax=Pelagicoccus sp. SDUM812003 TaxID=3041267 RepID=UPI00280FA9CB|nr:hypothetical protein [Pelagicoccus sp. SDUM812003]MDQ8205779.1 hypothetical protein [Pelagicoccus sp. SDUM812003]